MAQWRTGKVLLTFLSMILGFHICLGFNENKNLQIKFMNGFNISA